MAKCVLIMGKSGSGKSTSMRNFTPDELGIINIMGKELPFRNNFKTFNSRKYGEVSKAILQSTKSSVVVDDAGYLMTDYFMKNHASGNGFSTYNEIGDGFYTMIENAKTKLPDDRIAYFVMHETGDELNGVKPKTLGKLLDEKVCVEGLFTIVLRSIYKDGKYLFATHTDGTDVAKSPLGMFEEDYIDNDLKEVDRIIRDYYDMNNNKAKEYNDESSK